MRLLLTVCLCVVTLTASTALAAVPKLRPQDARLADVLREGAARSATFKALVDRIEASDVIVYVSLNPLMKSSLSGTLTWMTRAAGVRYVRASISTDLSFEQMIATVAHELQHAVEVVDDPNVTDEKSLVDLYRRIGHQSSSATPSRWETAAAQQTGFQVRRELVLAPAKAVTARASGFGRS